MPDGASTLARWCISRISISKDGSSAFAAWRTSPARRLMPTLMLPDLTMTAWRAAAPIRVSSEGDRPVVPMTWTMRACAASSARRGRVAAGTVKSSTPSAVAKSGSGSAGDGNAVRAEAGEFAGVLADLRRAGPLHRSGERHTRALGDDADKGAPHAPGGADDDEPHVGHGNWLRRKERRGRPDISARRGRGKPYGCGPVVAFDDHETPCDIRASGSRPWPPRNSGTR